MRATKTKVFTAIAVVAALVAVAVYLHFRDPATPSTFEGWIEAYFIFVSPDETGRVETLSVREGDTVTVGAPLFTLDSDLQRAAVAENEAAVANAKVTYDRAQELLKRAVGSSSSSSSGLGRMQAPSASRCFHPPESSPAS